MPSALPIAAPIKPKLDLLAPPPKGLRDELKARGAKGFADWIKAQPQVLLTDTIKFARAAGLTEGTIVMRHVLKLIAVPIVTVFGLELGSTLAFAVVTETIFSWPGLGKLIIDSITSLDRPVMVAYLILVALLFVTINLVIDLTYAALDPRISRGAAS